RAVPLMAREVEVVHGAQTCDALLPCRTEALVCAVHVAKMGLAAAFGHHLAVDDRRLPGDALPGPVGVPGKSALVRVMAARLAVPVEIRQSIELRVAVGIVLVHDV